MTNKEYYEHRLEESRKALMALIAKVEHPTGDELTEVLVQAVNRIEELQEEAHELEDDEEEYIGTLEEVLDYLETDALQEIVASGHVNEYGETYS